MIAELIFFVTVTGNDFQSRQELNDIGIVAAEYFGFGREDKFLGEP